MRDEERPLAVMTHRLEGCYVKIERAKEHLENLSAEILGLNDLDPYDVVAKYEPESGDYVVRIETDYSPPLRWAAIAGDAVHNLRSALDLLVFQLVLANGKRPDTKTEFPIFLDPAKYKAGGPRKVKGADKATMRIFDGLQPCNETQAPDRHPLWLLHRLDIRDKHQLLNVVVAGAQTDQFKIRTGNFGIINGRYNAFICPIEHGAELGRFQLTSPEAEVDMEYHITFGVVFEDFGVDDNFAVVPTIKKIVQFVEAVPPLFESFLT
jgi:hypothetical protein